MEGLKCLKLNSFLFVAGKAYTEDKIRIHRIFILNTPRAATKEDVVEYFERFGEVSKVRFIKRPSRLMCIIDFVTAVAAARVLRETRQVFMNTIISIGPCESALQPDGRKLLNILNRYANGDSSPSEDDNLNQDAPIFNLNDDCFAQICKKLLDIEDKINFAITCKRFYNVMVMVSKAKYSTFDADVCDEWTRWETRIFFLIVGPQIKNLEISYLADKQLIFELVESYCINVEKIKIKSCTDKGVLRRTISKMQLLTDIELPNSNINDHFIKFFKMFKNLEYLNLNNNACITGRYIHTLKGLEKLSLCYCQSLTPKNFKKICKHLRKLQYLDISYCRLSKREHYEPIAQYLVQLETLKFLAIQESVNCLAQLPNLKELEITEFNPGCITEEFFNILAATHANQLEELKLDLVNLSLEMASSVGELKKVKVLYCNCERPSDEILAMFANMTDLEDIDLEDCSAITNDAVMLFLENCHKLKNISLKRCNRITPQFIPHALNVLEEQNNRWVRKGRVHLKLNFTVDNAARDAEFCKVNEFSDVLIISIDFELSEPISDSVAFDYSNEDYFYGDEDFEDTASDSADDFW